MSERKGITITKGALAVLLLSQVYLLGGCDAPEEVDEVVADGGDLESEYDAFRSWTGYTSEEYQPLECPYGQAVQGLDCRGDYCDNVALYCNSTGRVFGWYTWTPNFSEEGSGTADEGLCDGGDMWMTGVDCDGDYCDNLSLKCSQLVGSGTGECGWTEWYSEEQGPFNGYQGFFIKGMECDGSYCDNKRYYYCRML